MSCKTLNEEETELKTAYHEKKVLSEFMENFLNNKIPVITNKESYELPSRALCNALLFNNLSDEASTSAINLSRSPRNNLQSLQNVKETTENDNTPLIETQSTFSIQSINSLQTIVPFYSEMKILDKGGGFASNSNESLNENGFEPKKCQDASCSPIHFDECKPSTSTPIIKNNLKTPKILKENVISTNKKFDTKENEEYDLRKIGQPGIPGTFDLEHSIQRLNLRKEVNF